MQQLIRRAALLALLWWGLGALLVGGAVALAVWLVQNGAAVNAAIVLPIMAGVYCLALIPIALNYQRSRQFLIRMATQREAMTTRAPAPPDLTLALPPGQTATLHFRRKPGVANRPLSIYIVRMLVVTFVVEAAFSFFTSDVLPSPLNLYTGVPLWMQWLLVLLPLALCVLFCGRQIVLLARTSAQRLIIDDWGITRQRSGVRPQRLAWSEITDCVRVLFTTGDQALAAYALVGPQQYLEVHFAPLTTLAGQQKMEQYIFDPPDLAAYRALAERILATILARTGATLRVVGGAYYSQEGRRATFTLGMAAQDVGAQPEAFAPYQPAPEVLAWAHSYTGSYSLPVEQDFLMSRPVTAGRSVLDPLLRATALLIVGSALLFLLAPTLDPLARLVIVLILAVPCVVYFQLAWRRARRRTVEVIAEAQGLRQRGAAVQLFIPWREVQAWGVIPPSPRQPDPVYAVLWSGQTLTWREPQGMLLPGGPGNLRTAYVSASHALHALITVRSGQPMRLIRSA